ncbi:hypothetical protein MATL_G00197480 [Megalops atlanticus]|uniref:Uncharacterized protein n=1 Tax=Megalops atlanticus TaxID=7932 RepID=A0A9D3PM72_MEGAT|nr:hypothetical protein MATL_G00197480 [Megalops atlanticus]
MKPSGVSLLLLASLPLLATVSAEASSTTDSSGTDAKSTASPGLEEKSATSRPTATKIDSTEDQNKTSIDVPIGNKTAVTLPPKQKETENKTAAELTHQETVNRTVEELHPHKKHQQTLLQSLIQPSGNKTVVTPPHKQEGSSNSSTSNTVDDPVQKGPQQTNENPQTNGNDSQMKEDQPKSDKKMLWILLPVLGVLVAAVIFVVKSKCMNGSSHTDAAENGTENASFQSRSDCNKDGVMLLGVKTSSGGEDNAAAR